MASIICEKSFAVDSKFYNFYAGGDIAWSADGKLLYCLNTSEVTVVEVATGQVLHTFTLNAAADSSDGTTPSNKPKPEEEEDEDSIYTFALAPAGDHLATAHRSGLLRLWSTETRQVVKLWKAQHKGPVVKLAFSACGKLLCSSGADSTLRVWDFANSQCVCALKDYPGPALLLQFHPSVERTEIFAAGSDHAIYCWNYETRSLVHTLRGHLSQVTGLSFADDSATCRYLATASRDKVLIVWDMVSGQQHKVIPVFEELEGCCFLRSTSNKDKKAPASLDVVVASVQGNLKLVECQNAKLSTLVQNTDYEIRSLMMCHEAQQLAVVTAEQNVLVYAMDAAKTPVAVECVKQLIGFNDEILDLSLFGENERYLAVATNSKNIKVYDTESDMNCKIVSGHTDTVITLSSTGAADNLLLSSGKDLSIRLWQLDPAAFQLTCLVQANSCHTSTIGSIAFAFHSSLAFASVSQDGSLKVWRVKLAKAADEEGSFQLKYSALAHDKDVNCVTYSPNNKLVATASQDKTAKLWNADAASCLATLRGHTRGVWCVRFSPVDQVVLTSSSDCSMRLWSLAGYSCLKRFEQDCSILRAEFLDHGRYLIAAGADGLLKVWNIKTGGCVTTMDEHNERIWSLAVSGRTNKYFYSGAADSRLIKWRDCTEENRNEEIDKRQALMLEEQQLQSLLHQNEGMQKAFVLALKLNKPKTTYNIVCQYVRGRDTEALQGAIDQLNVDQKGTLLEHVKAWSTNSRHCKVANVILRYLLDDILVDPAQRGYNLSKTVEVLTPYMQRHFKRATELQKDLAFLEYLVKCM